MGKGKKRRPRQRHSGQQAKPENNGSDETEGNPVSSPQDAIEINNVKSNTEKVISDGIESINLTEQKQPSDSTNTSEKGAAGITQLTQENIIPLNKDFIPEKPQQANLPKPPGKFTSMTTTSGSVRRKLEPPSVQSTDKKLVGTEGKLIKVEVNFVPMKFDIPGGIIYHYDVDFEFPWKHEVKKSDRPFLIRVVEAFKKTHEKRLGNPYSIVHDGLKNIYTFRSLGFPSGEYLGTTVLNKDDSNTSEKVEMKVKMKFVGQVPVNEAVAEYIRRGTSATRPTDAIQILNIILGMTPQLHYPTVGRNYYNLDQKGSVIDLGGGKSLWIGTFKSVRMGWKPMLNIDMTNKPAYEKCSVLEFVSKFVNSSFRGNQQMANVEKELKGLKIRYSRPDGIKRDYRVNKLMQPANELKMKLDSGEIITIQKYFHNIYKYELQNPNMPCLHVGDPKKTIYVPMEFCELKQQVAPASKRMTDRESANMIRETAIPPGEKKRRIEKNMRAMNNYYATDPYANAFGIKVESKWLSFDARVLDPPKLCYQKVNDNKPAGEKFEKVFGGKWNMGANRDRVKYQFFQGAVLNVWGLLDLARLRDNERGKFIDCLYEEGKSRGLKIDFPHYSSADHRNLKNVEKAFLKLGDDIKNEKKMKPQLIMVVCGEKGPFRACLKFLGDAVLRIPTQFVMKPNVVGRDKKGPNVQTLHNICLKLNSKIGGVNHVLHTSVRPKILQVPAMIMGADVTHPSPAEISKKPSIAAVVGSSDPHASFYNTEVRLQKSGQAVEVIEKMEEMTLSLLKKFQIRNNRLPLKIIFYRDGVSEGQFIDILNSELMAIRKACMEFGDKYEPQITFIVAQKRHKAFPKPVRDSDGVGDNKNVPPGTVIDTEICHPTEQDFYLASQLAIKGTVKPAHYHVLWDDSKMSPDELQRLTYDLCHLYSRCERSVSYPAPTYYSHLAAFRAREHHNALIDKTPHHLSEEVSKASIKKMEHLDVTNYFI